MEPGRGCRASDCPGARVRDQIGRSHAGLTEGGGRALGRRRGGTELGGTRMVLRASERSGSRRWRLAPALQPPPKSQLLSSCSSSTSFSPGDFVLADFVSEN